MLNLYVNMLFFGLESWLHLAPMLLALAVLAGGRQRLWLFVGLGGFLLGQLLGATVLAGLQLVAVFALSAVIGVAAGALVRVAERPLLAVASFSGVGFFAFALCVVVGLGTPWSLIAAVIAGTSAATLLFRSFDRAMNINPVLAAAGTIAANIGLWFAILKQAGGWSELIITAVVVVVGLIHLFREFPVSAAAPAPRRAAGRVG
jgi:hypothetical protein